jgi:hypothetical protein
MGKNVYCWDMRARVTCLGSKNSDGELVDACLKCYASKGFYNMPNVANTRKQNEEVWRRPEWVEEVVDFIKAKNIRHFRWFSSGDCKWFELLLKIKEVMERTQKTFDYEGCSHWLPTRMYKFDKFKEVLDEMKKLPNVSVRYSSDSINGEYTLGLHGSTILQDTKINDPYVYVCPATLNHGSCGDCKECWNKDKELIAYKLH